MKKKSKILFSIFTILSFNFLAQCDCSAPFNAPHTVNGVTVSGAGSGAVTVEPPPFSSCSGPNIVSMPPNTIRLGTGATLTTPAPFTYTLTFSQPINEICVMIAGTGMTYDEIFEFSTNNGLPTITMVQGCYSNVVNNIIYSGLNAPSSGGGIFNIFNATPFTTMTIEGPGGAFGSLFAFCLDVNAGPSVSQPSSTPTVCLNTAMVNVTHTTNQVTGIGSPSGLPPGINASWTANTITINGTPTQTGVYNYSIPITGTNTPLQATGTITVNAIEEPTFNPIENQCFGANIPPLPTTSLNGFTGVWSPVIDNESSQNYTFTPLAGQCATQTSLDIEILPIPQVSFSSDVNAGCLPLVAEFTNTSASASVNCQWVFGNGTVDSNCAAATSIYNTVGCYDVTLQITDNNGCSANLTQTDFICVSSLPTASFNFNPKQIFISDPKASFTNTSTNFTSQLWNFGDGSPSSTEQNPLHSFPSQINSYLITLTVSNDLGCSDTTTQTIQIGLETLFFAPNSFTPNADEQNDVFLPKYFGGLDPYNYNLKIYNRWGEIVFESQNPNLGWDGTFNQAKVQSDIYNWEISYKETNIDERKTIKGHLSLQR